MSNNPADVFWGAFEKNPPAEDVVEEGVLGPPKMPVLEIRAGSTAGELSRYAITSAKHAVMCLRMIRRTATVDIYRLDHRSVKDFMKNGLLFNIIKLG